MAAIWPSAIATDADLYVAKNALQTTLATALGTGDTSVVLASATGFPVAGAVVIGNEVCFYTNISGATLTGVTRGADGTTAATHSVGVPVGAAIVAFHHNGLMAEIEAIETYLNTVLGKSTAVVAAEFAYLAGVTSAIQTQLNAKAPLASPTFTGTVTIPTPFTLGAVSVTATGTVMNYLVGVTSAIQTQINLKAPLAAPTFTGTAVFATLDAQTLLKGKGTATNDSASAGYIGEVIESAVTNVASGSNGVWADVTSVSLTAGNWLIFGQNLFAVTSVGTVTDVHMGVSSTSGNSTTGLTLGSTLMDTSLPNAAYNTSAYVTALNVKLSGTTIYYLKHMFTFSSGAWASYGRITAVRIR